MMDELTNSVSDHGPVLHVLVIGFHHQKGYQVDFAHPPILHGGRNLPDAWATLPCAALPDGAHNFDEDISIFHVPRLKDDYTAGTETVFGVSCCRQIEAKDLKVKEEGVTRRTVQKSVCVLMQMPLYGFVLSKLSLVTQAYFNERDFSKTDILQDFYTSLNHSLETARFHDTIFYIGLSPAAVITKLKQKVLTIFKLLLLQKKVLIWGNPVKDVCIAAITLVSLLPGVLQKGLARSSHTSQQPMGKVSQAPKDQHGLPLDIFEKGCIFHPYLSLQQMNNVTVPEVSGYLVGASNVLFKDQSHLDWDVMIDIESGSFQVNSNAMDRLLSLTTEDLRFCEYLVKTVQEKERGDNSVGWEGSDEWIRAQFKMYLLCMLAANENDMPDEEDGRFAFNSDFLSAWKTTSNYQAWCMTEHPGIDAIVRQHPFAGETTVNDVRLRLQSMLESITNNSDSGKKIEEAVIKTGQIVGGAWSSAKVTLSSWRGWISGIVQDIDTEVQDSAQRMKRSHSSADRKESDSEINGEELTRGMSISEEERLGLDISLSNSKKNSFDNR